MNLPPPLETDLQRAVLASLHAHGCLAWRNNSRVFRVPGKGGKDRLMRAGLGAASSDLVGILPGGRFLAVEVKRPGQRPTVNQLLWLEHVNAAGGLALWADTAATIDLLFRHLAHCDAEGGRLVIRFGPKARVEWVMQQEDSVAVRCRGPPGRPGTPPHDQPLPAGWCSSR